MLSIDSALFFRELGSAVNLKLFDTGTLNVLRSAIGSASFEDLPLPTQWDGFDPPHVALVESAGNRVFSFLISQTFEDTNELWVRDLDSIQEDAVVEVKHSCYDYRYYRRDRERWAMVAEKKDPFFMDVFQRGEYPLSVPTLDDNWSAFD